jgi:hypothetical protein
MRMHLLEWVCLASDADSHLGRESHAACTLGEGVYVFGGITSGGLLSNDLLHLTVGPPLCCWQHHPEGKPPPPTALHTMVGYDVDGTCIVFGGQVPHSTGAAGNQQPPPQQQLVGTNTLWVLRTRRPGASGIAWTAPATTGKPPCARIGHCAAMHEHSAGGAGTMFVYGGLVPDLVLTAAATAESPPNAGSYLCDFALLTLPGYDWSRPNLRSGSCSPPPCTSASLTAFGSGAAGKLLLFGGTSNAALLLDISLMTLRDLAADWASANVSPMATCRCNHSATLADGRVWILGGTTGEWECDGLLSLDVHTLDLVVVKAPSDSLPRQRHTAVAVSSGMLVLGGSCGGQLLRDAALLRPRGELAAQLAGPTAQLAGPTPGPTFPSTAVLALAADIHRLTDYGIFELSVHSQQAQSMTFLTVSITSLSCLTPPLSHAVR